MRLDILKQVVFLNFSSGPLESNFDSSDEYPSQKILKIVQKIGKRLSRCFEKEFSVPQNIPSTSWLQFRLPPEKVRRNPKKFCWSNFAKIHYFFKFFVLQKLLRTQRNDLGQAWWKKFAKSGVFLARSLKRFLESAFFL